MLETNLGLGEYLQRVEAPLTSEGHWCPSRMRRASTGARWGWDNGNGELTTYKRIVHIKDILKIIGGKYIKDNRNQVSYCRNRELDIWKGRNLEWAL